MMVLEVVGQLEYVRACDMNDLNCRLACVLAGLPGDWLTCLLTGLRAGRLGC